MKKFKLSQEENLSINISHLLCPKEFQHIDLYFSIPDEMGISSKTLSEENYFHSSIRSHCAYYSEQVHLPLVRSRFISQTKGEQTDYRSNLNLFSHQYRKALETDVKQTIQIESVEEFYQSAIELLAQTQSLLKKLRRYTPPDQKLSSYFENVDNFLSWKTEQLFLKLVASGPKSSEHSEQREQLLDLCKQESAHRTENKYNTKITISDPNRITNKMRLLQRLSEFGVVFKRQTFNLNANLKRLVRGSVTAVIMAFVMAIVLNARTAYTEVTLVLIASLGLIYGIREIFKDDLTSYLWRKIQHGRPKWQHIFSNGLTKNRICSQTIWLEYIKKKDLPKEVDALLMKRRQQNRQSAQLLHFRCDTRVVAKGFIPGFEEIQNQIVFNLTPFNRFLKKGEGRLYALDANKISNQGVERRYQINLVIKQSNRQNEHILQRAKITINRSKIVNIELMKAHQNFQEEPEEPLAISD